MNAFLFTFCPLLAVVHGMFFMGNGTSPRDKKDIAAGALHAYNLLNKTDSYWRTVFVLEEELPSGDRLIGIFGQETECKRKKKLLTVAEVNSPACPLFESGKTYVCFIYYDEENQEFDVHETSCKEKNYRKEQATFNLLSAIDTMKKKKKKKRVSLCGLN